MNDVSRAVSVNNNTLIMIICDDTALHRDRLIEGGASSAPAQHYI